MRPGSFWDAFFWSVITTGLGLAVYMFLWQPPPIPAVVVPRPDPIEVSEAIEPIEVSTSAIPQRPPVELVLVESRYLEVTCYHRWSDSPPSRGRYANYDDERLPISERVIAEDHYTVALTLGMDQYHSDLVRLPTGLWTHRYRFHVPGYNTEVGPGQFSVPRDRMPAQWRGRLDVLFTGCKQACESKAQKWGKRRLLVHIFEVKVNA